MKRSLAARTATVLAAGALAAPIVAFGSASSAHGAGWPTPPLNPAPSDAYTCTTNGAGTHCKAHTEETYGPVPTGLTCDSGAATFEILDQATRIVDAERWYDRDGNAVKRKRIITFLDAILSSPSGATVGYSQRDIEIDDFTTDTTYSNGSLRSTVPGLGAVLVEKGRLVWGPEGELLKEAGHHELIDYLQGEAGALDKLCDALG